MKRFLEIIVAVLLPLVALVACGEASPPTEVFDLNGPTWMEVPQPHIPDYPYALSVTAYSDGSMDVEYLWAAGDGTVVIANWKFTRPAPGESVQEYKYVRDNVCGSEYIGFGLGHDGFTRWDKSHEYIYVGSSC